MEQRTTACVARNLRNQLQAIPGRSTLGVVQKTLPQATRADLPFGAT